MYFKKKEKHLSSLPGEDQLKGLFSRHYQDACFFASRLIMDANAAEDVVQDVFIGFYEKGLLAATGELEEAYLYKSIKNRCLDYLKHRKVEDRFRETTPMQISEDYVFASIAETEALSVLSRAVDMLPDMCRKVTRLALEGHSGVEIAEILQITSSTVRSQKKRAIELLRDRLDPALFLSIFIIFFRPEKEKTGKIK